MKLYLLTFFLLALGASLHNILTRLKALPEAYPVLDLAYCPESPVSEPVILGLTDNGLRLRFDGPEQRLRLIEVVDFTKSLLTYKGNDILKAGSPDAPQESFGPKFKHVYHRLFGPSYPGEYIPPSANESHGTYVLSYPGVAFSFPVLHSSWAPDRDFVSLMSSNAAEPASSMAVFSGESWADARSNIFTRTPMYPRLAALAGKNKEYLADEIDLVRVLGGGKVELVRKASTPFLIVLSETTPQDLIAELGPPDAIYRKNDHRITIHEGDDPENPTEIATSPSSSQAPTDLADLDGTPDNSAIEDSGEDSSSSREQENVSVDGECFYNYFNHGFDIHISYPITPGPPFPGSVESPSSPTLAPSQLTATKILLHGNVPGSYQFNRHRRIRWVLDVNGETSLDSETSFRTISPKLKSLWQNYYASPEEEAAFQRSMVLNRGWGETSSPGNSVNFLGSWEESTGTKQGEQSAVEEAQALGNTELTGFPGLLFEVVKNGAISCLTVY